MRLNWGTAPLSLFDIFEACLVIAAIVIALLRPGLASNWFSRIEMALGKLSNHRWLCGLILFLFPIVLRLIILPVYRPPVPFISDEYAYLLQSDTFASGRLTNPPPPFPEHFASVYVLAQPTYAAEYQVGQGLTLATGQALTGWPWAGVVLSMGLMCALIYWALLGWLPANWAFVGALVTVDVPLGVLSYWMNSYWGGCVPAIGGTLVLGSLVRLRSSRPTLYSIVTAAGLIILINSRPLEGTFLTAVVACALVYWTFVAKQLRVRAFIGQVVPALAIGSLAAIAFAGYYNQRVTGKPAEFPYLLYRSEYGLPQGFFWQKPVIVPVAQMPSDIRSEYEDQLRQHERRKALKPLIGAMGGKLRRFWEFYIGIPLTLPLLFLPFIWRGPDMKLAMWTLLVVLGLDNLTFFAYFPHYSAAVIAAIALVLIHCLRRMRASGQAGLFLSRALPLICLAGLLVPMCGRLIENGRPAALAKLRNLWQSQFLHDVDRENFVPRLEQEPGRQLVLVRYKPYKNDGVKKFEWIFNRADLSTAKIVWAREMDAASNEQLLRYFAGRKLWLAKPDAIPPTITPYSPGSDPK